MSLQKTVGFTHIERMITGALVGIQAAIAYPAYRDEMCANRRLRRHKAHFCRPPTVTLSMSAIERLRKLATKSRRHH